MLGGVAFWRVKPNVTDRLSRTSPLLIHTAIFLLSFLLRICGFSPGWWKVGSWYLLYVEVQPHCNVLVNVIVDRTTQLSERPTKQHYHDHEHKAIETATIAIIVKFLRVTIY
jgi:hypothetical protein